MKRLFIFFVMAISLIFTLSFSSYSETKEDISDKLNDSFEESFKENEEKPEEFSKEVYDLIKESESHGFSSDKPSNKVLILKDDISKNNINELLKLLKDNKASILTRNSSLNNNIDKIIEIKITESKLKELKPKLKDLGVSFFRAPYSIIKNCSSLDKNIDLTNISKIPNRGKGIKIAIIDNAFNIEHIDKKIKNRIKKVYAFKEDNISDISDPTNNHGDSILETINKIAPEADLFLIAVPKDRDASLISNALDYAVEAFKVNIVSISINDPKAKDFFDGTGAYAKKIETYTKKNKAFFVVASGNNSKNHYYDTFRPDNNGLHDYNDKTFSFKALEDQKINISFTWNGKKKNKLLYNFHVKVFNNKSSFSITNFENPDKEDSENNRYSSKIISFDAIKNRAYYLQFKVEDLTKSKNSPDRFLTAKNIKDLKIPFHIIVYNEGKIETNNFIKENSLEPNLAVAKYAFTIGAVNYDLKTRQIISSDSTSFGNKAILKPDFSGYSSFNASNECFRGSSASVPYVASTIGLLLAKNKNLNYDDVKNILKNTSKKIGNTDWSLSYGYGLVDTYKAWEKVKK